MDKDTTKITFRELFNQDLEKYFSNYIREERLDRYVKKFTTEAFFKSNVIAHLKELDSLAHMATFCSNDQDAQAILGFESISKSQISRKQNELSPAVLEQLFHYVLLQVQARLGHTSAFRELGKLHIIDSSTISMSLSQYPWAAFRKTKAGVKLHLRVEVNKDGTLPSKALIGPAKQADRTQMNELVDVDSDALYLFDRAYVDYKQFDCFCEREIRFITRLKANAAMEIVEERSPDLENQIFQDTLVSLGKTGTTKMKHALRLIHTKDSENKDVTILTNCLDLTAKEIGDLYRYRWKIETFFKWMKQHLGIKQFYGKSMNAVTNQIWIALITYCLIMLIKLKQNSSHTLLEMKRLLAIHLTKPLSFFLQSLLRKPTKISRGRRKKNEAEEFNLIMKQFDEGNVAIYNDMTMDPLF